MKSIIIQIRGENPINLITKYGFNSTDTVLVPAIYNLYGSNTFILNSAVKSQLMAKLGGITDNHLKVQVSRLIKCGAIVKDGRLLGLNVAYKDADKVEQVVLRLL